MNARYIMAGGAAASVLAWAASPELPMLARGAVAFLVGAFPALALLQSGALGDVTQLPSRLKLYATTIFGLWGLTFAIALASSESGFNPRLIGVTEMPFAPFLMWTGISLVASAALILAFKAFGTRETQVLEHLVPQTALEKLVYVGVSLTAGICEEFVFRGFLLGALRVSTGSALFATLLSAGAFGIAHAHQDAAGALRATLLALVLSVPVLVTGSLYPGIAAHAIVDIAGGLWLSKWLLRS
jgi:uncharacterized protein